MSSHYYLTPAEVARELHVSAKTVSRWASEGRIPCVVTLGGHRRFRKEDVAEILRRMSGAEGATPLQPDGDAPPPDP